MEEKLLEKPLSLLLETVEFLKGEAEKDPASREVEELLRMYLRAYAFKRNEIKRHIHKIASTEVHLKSLEMIEGLLPQRKEGFEKEKEEVIHSLCTHFNAEDIAFVQERVNVCNENFSAILYSITTIIEECLSDLIKDLREQLSAVEILKESYAEEIKEKTFTGLHTVIPVKKEMYSVRIKNKSLLPKELFDIREIPNESRIKKWALENPEKTAEAVEVFKKDKYLKVIPVKE